MNKKLIFFDIDGTLYDGVNKQVPESTIKALKQLKNNGHILSIATGRSYNMINSLTEVKEIISNYLLINGQYILCNNTPIYSCPVERQTLCKLLDSFVALGVKYGMQSADGEALCPDGEDIREAFKEFGIDVPTEEEYHLKNIVYQVWCFGTPEEVVILESQNPEFNFVPWGKFGYDVVLKGNSKGKSIKVMAEYYNIDIKDTIAFGDGKNDIEMISTAGLGIAMGNAISEVKEVSDYVTDEVGNDGIYKALKHFKLI